ncbi:MAG: hypothetical protein QF376_04815 [Anaerolineales bacterium]|jgi:polyphosphate glucokinase|nr:hypothetical protein [Anaerolineales bacterium]HJO33679.1 hypothetical protein [Anaerolineales bacterium]
MKFGAGRGESGVVMVLTFGTGIGSAQFVDGKLLPNVEMVRFELDGQLAEPRAAAQRRY